jgi:Uncharacterized protein conserved in bacteria (DUF2066)
VRPGLAAPLFAVFALIAVAGAGPSRAADSPYTGEVPVASQGDSDRAQGLKAAFGQVVARVAGNDAVLSRPEVAKAIGEADRYVQQFQYRQDVVSDGGQAQARLTLVAEFDHDAVDRLVQGAAAPPAVAADDAPSPAPADTAASTFHVWVGGVRSASDYARMMSAIAGNDYVRDAHVELARGDGVQLRLVTSVPLARMLAVLDAGMVLHVTNAKPPVDGIDALLDLKP